MASIDVFVDDQDAVPLGHSRASTRKRAGLDRYSSAELPRADVSKRATNKPAGLVRVWELTDGRLSARWVR